METVKKLLGSIFICLLSIFLMSHNVSALSNYDVLTGIRSLSFYTNRTDNCNNTNGTVYLEYIRTANFAVHNGNMLIAIPFQNSANNNSLDAYIPLNLNASFYVSPGSGASVVVLDAEVISNSTSQSTLYVLVNSNGSYSSASIKLSGPNYIQLREHECIENGYTTDVGINTTQLQDIAGQLNTINNSLGSLGSALNNLQDIEDKIEDLNDGVGDLNDTVKDHYEKEDEANDNISNQDASDLSGDTDNEASTNLVGLFQSFITALSNITQANNCNLSLAFPSYAGGTINVNVCQYKDKGGNIVAIFSSLTMVIFYIPLALKLLSIIYNEIRSFTNG